MSFVSDTMKRNDNHSLTNFPLGIALSSWGEQGYPSPDGHRHGCQLNDAQHAEEHRSHSLSSVGIFWCRTGATSRTQREGSMVFRGYDRAKVVGQPYTQFMIQGRSVCTTGMAVTITDLVLNFPNGIDASLFPSPRRPPSPAWSRTTRS